MSRAGKVLAEEARKIVLFSEWTTMLDLIERQLERFGADYVRLDGSVPQKKRQQLVNRFQRNAACRLILMTNAGSTGLNLQAADTVINVDLPWNPAVLEQRIGRAHRMGQRLGSGSQPHAAGLGIGGPPPLSEEPIFRNRWSRRHKRGGR